MKLLALDVHYRKDFAKIVCAVFASWHAKEADQYIVKSLHDIADYEPGNFYKRELPCLMEVLKDIDLQNIACIIIDGFVYLDNLGKKGLGAYLYENLEPKVPVIGIAKSSFYNNTAQVIQTKRGTSNNPLYISAVGTDPYEAAENVRNMAGHYRIPDLIKQVDTKTKEL